MELQLWLVGPHPGCMLESAWSFKKKPSAGAPLPAVQTGAVWAVQTGWVRAARARVGQTSREPRKHEQRHGWDLRVVRGERGRGRVGRLSCT